MADRTYKIFGYATQYAEGVEATATVTFNNQEVFSGAVNLDQDSDFYPVLQFVADTSIVGDIPVTISVTGGSFNLGPVYANYSVLDTYEQLYESYLETNPELPVSREQFDNKSTQLYIDSFHEINPTTETLDYRKNVMLNGVDVTVTFNPEKNNEDTRGWHYLVHEGDDFSFVLHVDAMDISPHVRPAV